MTASDLKNRTVRDLAVMARKKKVPGWHGMRKDELVKALLRRLRAEERRAQPPTVTAHRRPNTTTAVREVSRN